MKLTPASQIARDVLAALPPAWRTPPDWVADGRFIATSEGVRRRMAARIENALTAGGHTPEAIVAAVRRYPDPAVLAEHHAVALREVLRQLTADRASAPDCAMRTHAEPRTVEQIIHGLFPLHGP